MGYLKEEIDISEAIDRIRDFDYALVFKISDMKLIKAGEFAEKDLDELVEARIFSDNSEIHIFRYDDGLKCVKISDSGFDDVLVEKYDLEKRFSQIGKTVTVKKYIDYDDDGQAFIKLKRLAGIE